MKKNKSKKIKLIVTVSLIIVLAIWIGSIFINIKYISNWQTRGLFGDMFGSVNSLFSGLAFVGVILAIFLQSHELSLQRKELKKTQKVLRGQKQQLIIQNRTFTKQTFENTFFQLLNSHQILVESLNIFFVDQKFTGTRYFAHLYSDFRSTYKNLFLDNSNFEKHFPKIDKRDIEELMCCLSAPASVYEDSCEMGFSPGGRMHQEIYDDPYEFEDWHQSLGSRCFLHITNSLVWRAITDELPPTPPFTSKEYTKHGMPWFDYYDDNLNSIDGAENLKKLKSVVQMEKEKGLNVLPENKSVKIEQIVSLKDKANPERVREGRF